MVKGLSSPCESAGWLGSRRSNERENHAGRRNRRNFLDTATQRVLGRVISNTNPANNLCYEQTDGITCVYNSSSSAVAALTPYLTPSTGAGYSLQTALSNAGNVSLPCTGNLPS